MAGPLSSLFGQRGPLAKRLPSFSPRPEQLALAQSIHEALENGKPCLAEAGTGVGKTLAYLVPVVRRLEKTGGRAVISTHTLALQSQLIERDIPNLLTALESDLKAAVLKGRSNFLCHQELDVAAGEIWTAGDPAFKMIQRWSSETETGDVAELDFSYPGWADVAGNADTCRARECRHYERCFYYKARRIAEESQLLVVNHALFFADLRLRLSSPGGPSLIPNYEIAVFDEAHHVDDMATRAFGMEFSSRRIPMLIARCKRIAGLEQLALSTLEALHQRLFDPFLSAVYAEGFLDEALTDETKRGQFAELTHAVGAALDLLAKELTRIADGATRPAEKDKAAGLARVATRASTELQSFVPGKPTTESETETAATTEFFSWYHLRKTKLGGVTATLVRTPYEIAGPLASALLSRVPTVAFVSATLAATDGFAATKKRLGLSEPEPVESLQGSPFDYAKNCLLYIPRHLGPPANSADYTDRALLEIRTLIEAAKGRTFVLFTSHRMLQQAKTALADGLGYPLFVQGEQPNGRLIEAFTKSGSGVLLGTSSFWEGVDVPGEALSCVILDKLPFATPDSPPQRAREQRIKDEGGDAFKDWSLPQATIRLKQGFGRLLRTANDRGVVAILDSRLWTKSYGRQLLAALPPCTRTEQIEEVRAFFAP